MDMVKKIRHWILLVLLLCVAMPMTSLADDDAMSFQFNLTVDGQTTKEVSTDDIITVVLKLRREDSDDKYTMYAMQDEIRYDSKFFELVEGSAILGPGIVSTDIAMVDHYREFYMNYLSLSGGSTWDADMLIGSFQLRVIGDTGVTKITNQDYLVSLQDGSGHYFSEANEVTIILSTECNVRFHTSGGTEIPEQMIQYGEKIPRPTDPIRAGYHLVGWYTDIDLTEEWDFERDVVQGNMSLYAKWEKGDPVIVPVEDDTCCFRWYWLLIILLLLGLYLGYRRYKKIAEKKSKRQKMLQEKYEFQKKSE